MTILGSKPAAGVRVVGYPGSRGLRVAVLTAVLVATPLLARNASAQRSGSIQATATVITSNLGAGFRQDSVGAPVRPAARPASRALVIEGVGLLEIQTGPGAEPPLASRVVDRRGATVAIQIFFVGT